MLVKFLTNVTRYGRWYYASDVHDVDFGDELVKAGLAEKAEAGPQAADDAQGSQDTGDPPKAGDAGSQAAAGWALETADLTVDGLTEAIEGVDDPEALYLLAAAEQDGRNRKGAHEAIKARLEELGE